MFGSVCTGALSAVGVQSTAVAYAVLCRDLIDSQPVQPVKLAAEPAEPVSEGPPAASVQKGAVAAVKGPVNLLAQRHSPLRPVPRGDVTSASKAWQVPAAGVQAANGVAGDPAAGPKVMSAAARVGGNWLPRPEDVRPGGWQRPRRDAVEMQDAKQARSGIWNKPRTVRAVG